MTAKLFPTLVVSVLSLLCASCASIVSSNESTTYIETFPEDARCELHGQDFSRVITTPGSVHLPSEAAPVTVSCKKEDYFTTAQTLDTSMDGWIFGNLLFGGIIGGVVDIARGAGQKFPPKFSMVLDPKSFDTAAERDEYYDKRVESINAKWDDLVARIEARCKNKDSGTMTAGPSSSDCAKKAGEAQEKRHAEIAAVEDRRNNAAVASTQPLAAPSVQAVQAAPSVQATQVAQ
jgi:hypothetical protein